MDRRRRLPRGVTICFGVCLLAALPLARGDTHAPALLAPADAFRLEASRPEAHLVRLRWTIEEGYYLYRERLRFRGGRPAVALAPALPPGRLREDPFFGRTEIYRHGVVIEVVLEAKAAASEVFSLEVGSQGCADIGICFPPESRQVTLRVGETAGPAPAEPFAPAPFTGTGGLEDPLRAPE